MCSLRAAFTSTTRPWRPLYAYACCCLLPLSLALRPASRMVFSSNPAATTAAARSRASRGAGSGRLGGLHRSSTRSTTTAAVRLASSYLAEAGKRRQRRPLLPSFAVGGFMGAVASQTESGGGGKGFTTGAGAGRGRRGGAAGALSMGKGLDRKKAKKSQVVQP